MRKLLIGAILLLLIPSLLLPVLAATQHENENSSPINGENTELEQFDEDTASEQAENNDEFESETEENRNEEETEGMDESDEFSAEEGTTSEGLTDDQDGLEEEASEELSNDEEGLQEENPENSSESELTEDETNNSQSDAEEVTEEEETFTEDGQLEDEEKEQVVNEEEESIVSPSFDTDIRTLTNEVSFELTKEAQPTTNYAEWEITLTIEGEPVEKTTDIVLVLDRSGSMSGSRMQKAKAAARSFVENLLYEGSPVRIALVSFGENAITNRDFTTFNNRNSLISAINSLNANGGTNIQDGLRRAKELLQNSTADQQTIVLLSDGEPTYSFKAGSATSYSWPNNKYNFRLDNFNYNNRLGNGSQYEFETRREWIIFPIWGRDVCDGCYDVNGYSVETNGIATISEAQNIIDTGIDIYSIGLDVGNNTNAIYTLQNSQNKGYYAGGEDDLSPIFDEILTSITHIATDSVVIDPLGEKFTLVEDGSFNGDHFSVSHGTISFDEQTKTITWDIGTMIPNEVYTLTYKVTLDWEEDPQGNVLYPTNKPTTLYYKDLEEIDQEEPFPIPEVQITTGKIVKVGYRVNSAGEPVDGSGNVVGSIQDAAKFYDLVFGDNLLFNKSYEVDAEVVDHFTLIVGDDPTEVFIDENNPYEVVYFGYVKTTDLAGGDVTVKYVDENGQDLITPEVLTGNFGDHYTTDQKVFPGYTFKEMDPGSAPASGQFTFYEQTVIYVYEQILGTVTVIKTDENNAPLAGATFVLEDELGNVVAEFTTNYTGEITFTNLPWGTYYVVETKAPAGYVKKLQPIEVVIDENNLTESITVVNEEISWEIPDTGGIGTLGFYIAGVILIIISFWLIHSRRKLN